MEVFLQVDSIFSNNNFSLTMTRNILTSLGAICCVNSDWKYSCKNASVESYEPRRMVEPDNVEGFHWGYFEFQQGLGEVLDISLKLVKSPDIPLLVLFPPHNYFIIVFCCRSIKHVDQCKRGLRTRPLLLNHNRQLSTVIGCP